jgi:hypothetical protein
MAAALLAAGQRRQKENIAKHVELLKKREVQHEAGVARVGELEKALARAQQDVAQWQGQVGAGLVAGWWQD